MHNIVCLLKACTHLQLPWGLLVETQGITAWHSLGCRQKDTDTLEH